MEMTRWQTAQQKAILKKHTPAEGGAREFKSMHTGFGGNALFITFTIGLIGDENTMASIFARDTYRFRIGKRGGVSWMNKNGKWVSKGCHTTCKF